MMPKGVEHPKRTENDTGRTGVKIPMMPKGVEHLALSNIKAAAFE